MADGQETTRFMTYVLKIIFFLTILPDLKLSTFIIVYPPCIKWRIILSIQKANQKNEILNSLYIQNNQPKISYSVISGLLFYNIHRLTFKIPTFPYKIKYL